VDDEVVFRSSLKAALDWQEHGFQICGEANSGLSAKQMIEELKPDIVITDICMAEADGLSLIALIRDQYPRIQVIALSGYDDYEYVRNSMKNGAIDYLLKHRLKGDSLLAALRTAEQRLAGGARPNSGNEPRRATQERRLAVQRQSLLRGLLQGEVKDAADMGQSLERFGLQFLKGQMILAVAAIDGMSLHKQKYDQQQWWNIFDMVIEISNSIVSEMTGGVAVPLGDDRFALLFCPKGGNSHMLFYNLANECITQLRRALKMHCNLTACYSISAIFDGYARIARAYQKICALLDEKTYHDDDMIITEKAGKADPSAAAGIGRAAAHYNISIQDEQAISKMLKGTDEAGLIAYIEKIFEDRRKWHLDAGRLQIVLAELLNLLSRELRECSLDIAEIYPSYHQIFGRIQYMTLNEMKLCVLDCCQKVLEAVRQFGLARQDGCHTVTKQACGYINRLYSQNISLHDVAAEIGVTPSYLSRIFKKDMKKTVVEYLNQIRIEHAKKLIREGGARLSELAGLVGFNSNTYFFTVFKQTTGKTPMQYRQKEKHD
jgi:two-component system response regulator YesN